ncbi:Uncharacterised protein [Mannheimia haemolytica]|uniref:hypothetical protein n=1 Tax=Mannheimia haemolytica TaxID=75985 RepID=UPI000DA2B8F6|nr:hypothetical protein [Mannheimia haemolytica]SQE29861.1 Uncharacterised protein [Mannheimia haemolytica]HDZ3645687.1 hypothetical protein [Mannheimia haemolytica]HDZ6746261.1 hypothetical protein [Mannheimia haemolytica]HDZ6813519.1 hypothetical protein [Mannheimia haemolytica]
MFKQPFFKEWFTLAEIAQFLRNVHKINYSHLELLKRLDDSNLVEFYIYLSGGYDLEGLYIGTQEREIEFTAFILSEYMYDTDYNGSFQQLEDFILAQNGEEVEIKGENTKIYIKYDDEEKECYPTLFSGLFSLPLEIFNEQNFLFSDGTALYLPEYAFYSTFELVENPAKSNSSYNFSFLLIQFDHSKGQGKINLDDIKIHLPAYTMQDFIAYFAPNQIPNQPEQRLEAVKNKSNEKPKNGKDFYNDAMFESIKLTAEANPNAGGYTIINAVIEAFCEHYHIKKHDLYGNKHYLEQSKAKYKMTFPDRRGRQKIELNVIIAS